MKISIKCKPSMPTHILSVLLFAAPCLIGLAAIPASAIDLDFVTVGDAGNPNDTTGYGSVGYNYAIGTYEVTLNQYSAFLNAVAATDTYSLYNTNMGTDLISAGIAQSGASGSYSYLVIGDGQRPVTYVNWFDAARFTNWLHNGQPSGAQDSGTTETGAYTLNGITRRQNNLTIDKNANAGYWVPSENEWYKAAYYDPNKGGLGVGGYWLYATQSDTRPNSRNGSATDPNSANYYWDDGIANGYNGGDAVTNSTRPYATYDHSRNYLTDVGAFTQAKSHYGTYDQAGNVWEWEDTRVGSSFNFPSAGLRGGSWDSGPWDPADASQLQSIYRGGSDVLSEDYRIGFRVATVPVSVPELSTWAMLAAGTATIFTLASHVRQQQ